jgi:ATP-dependent Clp protease ATP-binding subunit ClpA
MWQRFTEGARHVILLAQEEAGKMGTSHVGTEHLLLGLMRVGDSVGAQLLLKVGIMLDDVRGEIKDAIDQKEESPGSEPKLTPRAKRVLELAADESRRMRHNYIGTEHLLLALIREEDGIAANVLRKLGLDLDKARLIVEECLNPESPNLPLGIRSVEAVAKSAGLLPILALLLTEVDAAQRSLTAGNLSEVKARLERLETELSELLTDRRICERLRDIPPANEK